MKSRLLWFFVALACSTGCAVDPPTPLERDPEHVALAEGSPLGLRIAIAPIQLPQRDAAGVAALGSAAAAWPAREYASESAVPLDARELQRRLGRVGTWVLGGEESLLTSEGGAADEVALLAQAEAEGAELLVRLELLKSRASWIERDGLWWWGNLFLFWGIGVYPMLFVSDEVYAVELMAQLEVREVRSGRTLLARTLAAGHARSLNHPQRGWSLGGLLWLHPYTLDEEDYREVGRALYPHARKDLERQVAQLLSTELRQQVEPLLPQIRAGALGPRLRALVIGVNGPSAEWDFDHPGPLAGAEQDAADVAKHLRACGVRPLVLSGAAATKEAIEANLQRLAGGMRASDRLLVYFAGFGRTNREGLPAWIVADGPLVLGPLADRLSGYAPAQARVDFVCDASFGALGGGRTFPGGSPLARGSLGALVEDRPWRLLCAARPEQTAVESKAPLPRGLFSEWLLTAAAGAGDRDNDGQLSLREAWGFLVRWVPQEAQEAGAEQRPCMWGGERDAPFFPLRLPQPPNPAPAAPLTPQAEASPDPLTGDAPAPTEPLAPAEPAPAPTPDEWRLEPEGDEIPTVPPAASEDEIPSAPARPGQ
ncbi:MAG TPA: hypothetical protein DEA08_26430 [Planctomycetes bacterium]|nr:hypothetical protein [Planctomycetota bacterium]